MLDLVQEPALIEVNDQISSSILFFLINSILRHVSLLFVVLHSFGADALELEAMICLLDILQEASQRERLVAHTLDVDASHEADVLDEKLHLTEAVLRCKLDHQVEVLLGVDSGTAALLLDNLDIQRLLLFVR